MSFSNLISSALEQATSGSHSSSGGYSGGGGGYGNSGSYDPEFSSAQHHAQSHESSSDSSLFSSALGFLSDRKSQYSEQPDIDEEHLVQSHQRLYNGGGGGGYGGEQQQHDSSSLGAGAAMQALKMFTSGGGGSSGGDKNEFIGMAMAQASKLWEEKAGSGNVVSHILFFLWWWWWCGLTGVCFGQSGDKQSAVNSAAEMAFKMYMKSQGSGSSGTGGPGALMSLASKFL